MSIRPQQYAITDTAQQMVGGFLLAGPFVVTEEVWILASNMTWLQTTFSVVIVGLIGYGALYQADEDRDPDRELNVAGLPARFLSLMAVAYGSVTILAITVNAPQTFLVDGAILSDPTPMELTLASAKAIAVGAIFSVVGAATADSVF